MRYISLRRRPKCFLAFSGLTVEEFDRLVAIIHDDWIFQRSERLDKNLPHRKRKPGAGRKYELPNLEDQLLLTLVWSRLYLIYLALEYLFDVDESTVSRTIGRIQPLLKERFTLPERLPQKKIRTLEELKKYLPPDIGLDDILADATEQPIPRPATKRKREAHRSGRKRRYTVKTQIATTKKGFIIHISPSSGGRTYEYTLFHDSGLPQVVPKESILYVDAGYQGITGDYPNLRVKIPFRRKSNHLILTRSEKIFNKKQRRVRIRVENTLGRMKKFRALSDIYRHSLHNYNQTFRFVANVVNFRMLQRLQAS